MKFSIVILHYQTAIDTEECVNSIRKYPEFNQGNIEIIIVDNGSPNGSGIKLKKKYSNSSKIHILLLKKNIGFAKGNNVGIEYVRRNLDNDMIILSNSDITFTQKNFFEKIEEIYNKTNFALLGPDIRKIVGNEIDYQNPKMIDVNIDSQFLKREMIKLRLITNRSIIRFYLAMIPPFGFLKEKLSKRHIRKHVPDSKIDSKIMLYGAFLIFSQKYLEVFPNGLFDQTFMYGEEHAITYQIQSRKLVQIYTNELFVNHIEGSSTLSNRTQIERTKFMRDNALKSLQQLLNYIEN